MLIELGYESSKIKSGELFYSVFVNFVYFEYFLKFGYKTINAQVSITDSPFSNLCKIGAIPHILRYIYLKL